MVDRGWPWLTGGGRGDREGLVVEKKGCSDFQVAGTIGGQGRQRVPWGG